MKLFLNVFTVRGYHGALRRFNELAPDYFHVIENAEIYGFLSCDPCPPLELLESYLRKEGRRLTMRPKKKEFSLEDFSVKLFLRKIGGDLDIPPGRN